MTDFGRIQPPQSYTDPDSLDYWAAPGWDDEDRRDMQRRYADWVHLTPVKAVIDLLDEGENKAA